MQVLRTALCALVLSGSLAGCISYTREYDGGYGRPYYYYDNGYYGHRYHSSSYYYYAPGYYYYHD